MILFKLYITCGRSGYISTKSKTEFKNIFLFPNFKARKTEHSSTELLFLFSVVHNLQQ